MKKYDNVYINGDSYSAPTGKHLVYSDFIAQELNVPVINQSVPGSNNYRIFRTSVESLLSARQESPISNMLAIIGLSFVTRDEIWYEDSEQTLLNKIPDLDIYPYSKLLTSDFLLDNKGWSATRDIIVDLNINRQLTHFYTSLFMFVNTLENHNIDYIIFSAADNSDWRNADWNFLKSLEVFNQCNRNSNIIDLHTFNIRAFAKERNLTTTSTYHLFEDGHKEFGRFLLDKINEI